MLLFLVNKQLDLLSVDYQIVTGFNTIEHPPTPFKGGFTISASPPLKGVGGGQWYLKFPKR